MWLSPALLGCPASWGLPGAGTQGLAQKADGIAGGVLGWVWPGTLHVGQLRGGDPSVWFFRSGRDKHCGEHGVWAPRGYNVGLGVGLQGCQHLHHGLG